LPATLYALLVGIDEYRAPVPYLRGCANDIRAFESLLTNQAAHDEMRVAAKVLLNQAATRAAVIDGFLTHLGQAGAGDVALFYYSGHGSQERTPPELLELEPDGLDETLVCYDSRDPGNYDLADKELASLIRHVARSTAHVLVVLDCCHSGSGTRALLDDGAFVRRAAASTGLRSLDTFFVAPGDAAPKGSPAQATWMQPPGRHVVLSACHDDEEAKETLGLVPQRGAFSYYLTEALTNSLGRSTYRDIFNQVSSRVRATTPRQSPVMEAVVSADMDRAFLGGAIEPHQAYFTIHFDKAWIVDAGSVQGIPAPVGDETTVFALFPATAKLDPDSGLQGQIGSARVTASSAVSSKVELSLLSGTPDTTLTYKAVIVGLPMPPLGVKFAGDPQALALVRRELAECGADKKPSLLVAESSENFRLTLLARDNRYRLSRAGDDHTLAVDVESLTPPSARHVVERLEHMARWIRVLDLQNPSGRLPAGSVVLNVYRIAEDGTESLIGSEDESAIPRLVYTRKGDEYKPAQLKVVIRNRSPRRLFCALIDLPGTFGVASLLPGGTARLEPGADITAIVGGSTVFEAAILDDAIARGVFQLDDTLKVIAGTEEWDPTLLEMPDLDVAETISKGATIPIADTLSRLVSRVRTRQIRPVAPGDALADWTTAELTVTIVRPRDEVDVPEAGKSVALAAGVTLMGHAGFEAVARLSAEEVASRDPDLQSPPLPPWLADHPLQVRPYQFPGGRADSPALSVLELREVTDTSAVTAAAPLVIRDEQPLAADETVLPYAFDGEFYIPLGFAESSGGATQISIVRLPNPNTKSLKSAFSIFFKKVISEHLGTSYPYPLLSAVSSTAGKPIYETEPERVAARVSGARSILLYIHGIIGDTQGMTASAFAAPPDGAAAARLTGEAYDLILAFDYENLNTPIEQTARDLKQRLLAAGLAPGHSKQLHIVAHSMGGLVARWFIEQEGGNTLVSRLTMLGTPNGGSPWSAYEQWFSTLLGLGLNGLAKIAWPPTVLGSLMRAVSWTGKAVVSQHGKIEVALAEMNPKSPFLKSLAAGADPGVPYAVIAGNTSLVRSGGDKEDRTRLERFLETLSPRDLLYRTTALAFFNLPNDVAVAVDAITNVPPARALPPSIHQVPCDHMSYFITPAALECIAGPERT
jgi:pimeloyl-ACP methyl ester carboxylesterase